MTRIGNGERLGCGDLIRAAQWFVVENGSQIDIHARIVPPDQEMRELIVIDDLELETADMICDAHNSAEQVKTLSDAARMVNGWMLQLLSVQPDADGEATRQYLKSALLDLPHVGVIE